MNSVSNRALVNFIIDTAIAGAFVVSAVSGLVFLLPAEWLTLSASSATALGVDYATWRTLHDWTAVIMIAGVALHTGLHWRWLTSMVRRLAGGGRAQARPTGTAPDRRARPAGAAAATPAPLASRASAPQAASAPVRELREGASRRSGARDGLTRHAFLKRAGAVGAAALVGGLVGRSAASSAVSWLDDGSSTSTTSSTTSVAQESVTGLGSAGDSESGAQSSAGTADGDQSAQTVTPAARVTIDAGRCTGCGRCLQACPYGVFATSGSTVAVSDAQACRLCGRCTHVCQARAITLNG